MQSVFQDRLLTRIDPTDQLQQCAFSGRRQPQHGAHLGLVDQPLGKAGVQTGQQGLGFKAAYGTCQSDLDGVHGALNRVPVAAIGAATLPNGAPWQADMTSAVVGNVHPELCEHADARQAPTSPSRLQELLVKS